MVLFPVVSFFIFGTLIGSFLNVVVLRLPAGKQLSGRSACPSCGAGLVYYELIPVVSYIFLGGKCRHCHKKISSRYFIVELATGACFALVSYHFFSGIPEYLNLLRWLMAVSLFIVIFIIDLEHFIILDKVLALGAGIFIILNLLTDIQNKSGFLDFNSFLIGGLLAGSLSAGAFFLLWFFSGGKWIGFGDVKLVFLLGLILGWPQTFVMLLLAFWLGTIVALPLLFLGMRKLQSAVPFGTFLTVAAFITLFFGSRLLTWYLRVIGFGA